jgi:predicted ArsR family transcriptional regulator
MEATPPRELSHTPSQIAIALGVPAVRVELLRLFARSDRATVSQLAHHIGCTRNGLRPHLAVLEELGVIQGETHRIRGAFRPTRVYRPVPARIEEIGWSLYDAVAGDLAPIEARA